VTKSILQSGVVVLVILEQNLQLYPEPGHINESQVNLYIYKIAAVRVSTCIYVPSKAKFYNYV